MKKYLIALLPIVMLGACTKDITSLNTNPKLYPTVPATTLFTQAEHVFVNTHTSANVNLNIFRLIEQQWQETTYNDESLYNINGRSINAGVWNSYYRDVLNNLKLAKDAIPTDASIPSADVKKNDIAIADILQVHAFYYLVTTFGNIPYSQAFDPKNNFPKYDDAVTVYKDLLTRLNADIAALNTGAASYGAADVIYKGDITKWKKFANTLKLKMGMTISDSDAATAKTTVESAVAGGVFTGNVDNATFAYLGATPNTNPIWVDLVQSGRTDFVACSTLTDQLNATLDPRGSKYFTDTPPALKGALPGAKANYDNFSHVSATITATTFPGLILDYAETEFYLAEAVEKGYTVGGTAAGHYAAGVQASFDYWGAGSATAYLALPSVAYSSANYKQLLGFQKWLADYNRGWDAWIETRRLDYPQLKAPSKAVGGFDATTPFPVRFNYPIAESNVNGANYKAASAAIGGDVVTSKLFFDKN
jgi:hypothetical protein